MNEKSTIKGKYRIWEIPYNKTTKNLSYSELLEHKKLVQEFENIVPNVYLQSLAENMVVAGGSIDASNELRVTYIAVGTGTTTPTATDTTLTTEVFRDTVDTQARDSKTAKSSILLEFGEANGNTLGEVGAFAGNASGTADSGTLASFALFASPIVKDATKAILIEINHSFADA